MGGNVAVKKGSDRGGDFKNLRACRRPRQIGCIMAFSTFNAPVPPNALFGRNTDPTLFGGTIDPALEVLCTNPAALGGGSGRITPVYPTKPFAPSVIGTLRTPQRRACRSRRRSGRRSRGATARAARMPTAPACFRSARWAAAH
jgi:hypothetical protein